MRTTLVAIAALFLAWLAFMASPYMALYRFTQAIQNRDLGAIEQRIDFPLLRSAITGQIAAALRGGGDGNPLGQSGGRVLRAAIDPLIEPFVSPEALMRLLSGAGPAQAAGAAAPFSPDLFASLERAWPFFLASEFRGFRAFQASVPPEQVPAERFRLIMRLQGDTWRVVGLDLPKTVRDRFVQTVRSGGLAAGAPKR